ncbi:MAG: leucyl aminopeptidase [Alphaproteobacteria bacterium]
MTVDTRMVDLFRRELELCKVGPGQTVAVLTEEQRCADYATGFLLAAQELGADAFQVNVSSKQGGGRGLAAVGANSLAGNRPAIEALKSADLVIDLMLLLFSPEQNEITQSGTRMLLVIEPLDILERMFPTEELRRRVEFGEELLKSAKEMHITSPAGTDVIYRLGKYPVMTEYGYTATPGRWDHWPSGFLFTSGHDDGVDGTVVLNTGDILYPLKRYVDQPIKLTIEKGKIIRIDGKGIDATIFKDFMDGYRDPRAFAISHIGWGLNENADWNRIATTSNLKDEIGMDGRAAYGNVLFSTGPNTELGGSNDTRCHLDIPLRGCSLSLDNKLIVRDGEIVPREMRAPGR